MLVYYIGMIIESNKWKIKEYQFIYNLEKVFIVPILCNSVHFRCHIMPNFCLSSKSGTASWDQHRRRTLWLFRRSKYRNRRCICLKSGTWSLCISRKHPASTRCILGCSWRKFCPHWRTSRDDSLLRIFDRPWKLYSRCTMESLECGR